MSTKSILVALLSVTIAACGNKIKEKKSEPQQQAPAPPATEQRLTLVNEISTAGIPDAGWNDADLNTFESKLNRLEALDSKLALVTDGADNSEPDLNIPNLRSFLFFARETKKARTRAIDIKPTNQDFVKLQILTRESEHLANERQRLGDIRETSSPEVLKQNLELIDRQIHNCEEQMVLMERNRGNWDATGTVNATEAIQVLSKVKDNLKGQREIFETLLRDSSPN